MELIREIVYKMEQFQALDDRSKIVLLFLAGVAAVGFLNCILGYRLLRFWMMLGGIVLGGIVGYFIVDALGDGSRNYYIFGSAGCGILLGVLAFFIYRVGIWTIGAALGFTVSFYFLHPMSYPVLFACILIGAAFGILALKFSKSVIIITSGILGGAMFGYAGARLLRRESFPYGLMAAAVASLLGILIQFLMNRQPKEKTEESEE